MSDAFFVPLGGDRYLATELTRGPWSPDLQHGGPPSALLGRAIERLPTDGRSRVARITLEFLRPMPVGEVLVTTEVARAGKSARITHATLVAQGKPVARATALGIRTTEVDLPPREPETTAFPAPETLERFVFTFFPDRPAYHQAVEARWVAGVWGSGRATVWMRPLFPLVAGEETSPLARVLIVADSGNGVSAALDPKRFTFVNPDLTVHLSRHPGGAWVCLDARTRVDRDGVGLAESALHDERGPIGRSLQSLIVEAR
jgi:hypothetical protein